MLDKGNDPPRRPAGVLKRRRLPLLWPKDREFRILSIDGGGIRGIFPAAFLAGLERQYLGGAPIARYFDLIAGTSTGGIIALGLAAGLTSADLADLYVKRGCEIFPPFRDHLLGAAERRLRNLCQFFRYRYDRKALLVVLQEKLGERKFGEARNRLCIPSFDGRHGDVYIFKTPHHPDFRMDGFESMTKVAAATAAAPTFFQPLQDNGYTFVDGGVWANDPIMIALVDVLSCFDVPRENVRILSLGCGADPYTVGKGKMICGGILAWKDVFYAAMRLQSLNAQGQAGLIIGPERIIRVDAPTNERKIQMDDWARASAELPSAAEAALSTSGNAVARMFLSTPAQSYEPLIDASQPRWMGARVP
jgi:patatin-like phospholipase/acyl hydrolase